MPVGEHFLRRLFPWLAPARSDLGSTPTYSHIMTIPAERTRAIIYTKLFLERLVDPRQITDVPDSVRATAVGLLRHYPGVSELEIAHRVLPDWFGPARKMEE